MQRTTRTLQEILAAAVAAHGHLSVDEVRFLAHLARQIPAAPEEWAPALARIHAADLYLAFACAEQVPGALAAFESACGTVIDGALSGQATAAFADDAKQLVREKLFIGGEVDPDEPAAGPRILSYAGRGPLAAWVAVSAQRTALSLRRREVSAQARHRAAAAEELAASVHPELAYLKRTYRAAFVDLLRGSVRGADQPRAHPASPAPGLPPAARSDGADVSGQYLDRLALARQRSREPAGADPRRFESPASSCAW